MIKLAGLLLAVAALLVLAAGALVAGRVAMASMPARAVLRGAAQLAVVSGVVGAALTDARAAAALVVVMTGAVAVTASRRPGGGRRRAGQVLLASACGAPPVLTVLLAADAFPRTPRYTTSFAGIVLGATMTACTTSARRLRDNARDRWPEVQAMLALGGTPRQAVLPLLAHCRRRVAAARRRPDPHHRAHHPASDLRRGPGGRASSMAAAQFQVAVLAALVAAQAIRSGVLLHLAAGDFAHAPAGAAP